MRLEVILSGMHFVSECLVCVCVFVFDVVQA